MSDPISRLNAALEGRYRIDKDLGEGGMAKVYLAQDLRHDRRVAIKVLKPELAAMVGGDRFVAEIKTTANLQHPHVLPLFDSGEADGFLYYVMPYIEGESLRGLLDREKQLPVEKAVAIARKLAGALSVAHEQGIIHRDIKPANILMANGEPVVADFGIALAVQEAGGGRLTETGLSVGTPYYMSPEQATGDRDPDARSDLYSLGCVLYEMLTGQPPFMGTTAQAVLSKILTSEADPPSSIRKSVPLHVDAAVMKTLERLPADRFSTADDFRRALEDREFSSGSSRIHSGAHRSGDADAGAGGGSIGTRIRAAQRPWQIATGVLGLALIGFFVSGLGSGDGSGDPPPVTRFALEFPEDQRIMTPQLGASMALSPDGQTLVYAGASFEAPWQLWIRQADQLEAQPLGGTAGGFSPLFSPDGNRVAYVGPDASLRVLDLSRGSSRTIADSAIIVSDWTPEGHLYYQRGITFGNTWRISEDGGDPEPVPVISGDPGLNPRWGFGDVLPGERGMLLTQFPEGIAGAGLGTVVAVDFGSEEVTPLVEGTDPSYLDQGYLVWGARDGSLMAAPFDLDAMELTGPPQAMEEGVLLDASSVVHYSISTNGSLVYRQGGNAAGSGGLMWIDREGERRRASDLDIGLTVGLWDALTLSPDGSQVALTMAEGLTSHIWIQSLEEDAPPNRVTFGGSFNVRPRWMPDGRTLVFVSDQGGLGAPTQAWVQTADGTGGARPLVAMEREIEEVIPSPAGDWVVVRAGGTTTNRDLFAIRPGIDSIPIPLAVTPANERSPDISPDGRWLAYVSDETGRDEVFVRPFPNVEDGKWQVSSGGGLTPLWGNTGRELFYVGQGNRVLAARYATTASSFAVTGVEPLFPVEGLFITGNNHTVFDVTPDDQEFIMLSLEGRASGLVWVQNWLTDLQRLQRD